MGIASVSRSTRKCNKMHPVGGFREIGTRLFPIVCVLFPIRFPSFGILHDIGNAWLFLSILIAWKDAARPTLWGRPGIKINIFSQNKATFLRSYSHRMVFYITLKIHRFSHQFFIAWVNAAKFVLWEDHDYGNFYSTYHMVTAWNNNGHVFF